MTFLKDIRAHGGGGVYTMRLSRCLGCYNKTTLLDNGRRKMIMKRVTKDKGASNNDDVAKMGVVLILDIVTCMKQTFTETDFLDEK